jgi:putative hydrolase of the HAD superfamily
VLRRQQARSILEAMSTRVDRRSDVATSAMSNIRQVAVFDGDDTLWETEPLYDQARILAGQVAASAGFDPEQFDRLQRAIDVAEFKNLGLSAERFPSSSVKALEALAHQEGRYVSSELIESVYRASRTVFDTPAPLLPFAKEVLVSLRSGYRLALLTKGDRDIQQRRIETSGLLRYFDVVEIVADKTPAVFQELLRKMNCEPSLSWSIGNSLPSDIVPALDAGMEAVWIEAHVWAHERYAPRDEALRRKWHIAEGLWQIPEVLGVRKQTI